MNPNVTAFISNDHKWEFILSQFRRIILECGLEEEFKWKQPCYTYKGKNIVILASFKNYCALSFFKGVFLQDEYNLLDSPGENSRTYRLLKITDPSLNIQNEQEIKAYIFEAIEIEKAGLKITNKKPKVKDFPEELKTAFIENPKLKQAFDKLTPGRQRGYIFNIKQAKQSKTRFSRIEKHTSRILNGYGINECICGHSKRMPTCDGSHKSMTH